MGDKLFFSVAAPGLLLSFCLVLHQLVQDQKLYFFCLNFCFFFSQLRWEKKAKATFDLLLKQKQRPLQKK
jgi:hypothetical protein